MTVCACPVPTSAGDAVDHFLFPWHLRPRGEDSKLTDVPQTLVNPMQRCHREGDGGTWGMELLFRSDGQGVSRLPQAVVVSGKMWGQRSQG